jgi:D-glycero-D-manno-heptose 1,7-bisphosphate phosphatase
MPMMMNSKKCVFLDRDGVINKDRGDYTYRVEDFQLIAGVTEAIKELRAAGYLLIVLTNQAGISKGIYTKKDMEACHNVLQKATNHAIEHIYYCPYHSIITESLCRKPGTLMIERAIAKYGIDTSKSWLIGDAERDIECGMKMGLKTIRIADPPNQPSKARYQTANLFEAARKIILPFINS